jgi:hypothetical protein
MTHWRIALQQSVLEFVLTCTKSWNYFRVAYKMEKVEKYSNPLSYV